MITVGFILVLAFLGDMVIGDPRSSWHPVVIIGNFIGFLDKLLRRESVCGFTKKIAGGILVIIVLCSTYAILWQIDRMLNQYLTQQAFWAEAILLMFVISPRSLAEAGKEIYSLLCANELPKARHKLSWIVGRDTETLPQSEVVRATVETIAENIVDGIISPLFYMVLGGLPLAYLYRSVNTMDSMIGYKNDKYIDFGMIAARLDDVMNYIPARITAVLIVIISIVYRLDWKNSIYIIRRDASKHPSPNSGLSEAGVAGALGVRLGGVNYYGGRESVRAYMGDGKYALNSAHISTTIQIMYGVTVLFIVLICFLEYLWWKTI